jgi:hypothetical protein
MTLSRLRLSGADARALAEGALRGIGYHDDEARIIADHVIDAAMCGYEYSGLAKILNVFDSEHFRLPRTLMMQALGLLAGSCSDAERATTAICSSPSGPTSLGHPTHSSGR